jgi:hypothetical protein
MAAKTYRHEPELGIPLCPCWECVRLDWDALDDDRPTFAAYLKDRRDDYELARK